VWFFCGGLRLSPTGARGSAGTQRALRVSLATSHSHFFLICYTSLLIQTLYCQVKKQKNERYETEDSRLKKESLRSQRSQRYPSSLRERRFRPAEEHHLHSNQLSPTPPDTSSGTSSENAPTIFDRTRVRICSMSSRGTSSTSSSCTCSSMRVRDDVAHSSR
jgi:hypothetical protein